MPSDLPPIIDGSTNASMEGKGSFVAGTLACFFFTFTDLDGNLFDPSDIEATISDSSNNTIETITAADKIELGICLINWNIPQDTTPGKYTIQVNYVVETSTGPDTRHFSEDFVVIEKGQGVATLRSFATVAFLESLLGYAQRIPVFHEPALLNRARTVAELTFPRWNQPAGNKVYINGELQEDGYSVDYLRGRITFENSLSVYDQVLVNYNFRWFTDEELRGFLDQGVNVFNIYPPQSIYNIQNIPDRFLIIAEYAAAVMAYRRLLMDTNWQEPVKVFGSFRRAQEVHGNLMEEKKNYEDSLKDMLAQKKFGPYPSIRTITVPEFALPGSRSRWMRYLFKGA